MQCALARSGAGVHMLLGNRIVRVRERPMQDMVRDLMVDLGGAKRTSMKDVVARMAAIRTGVL